MTERTPPALPAKDVLAAGRLLLTIAEGDKLTRDELREAKKLGRLLSGPAIEALADHDPELRDAIGPDPWRLRDG